MILISYAKHCPKCGAKLFDKPCSECAQDKSNKVKPPITQAASRKGKTRKRQARTGQLNKIIPLKGGKRNGKPK